MIHVICGCGKLIREIDNQTDQTEERTALCEQCDKNDGRYADSDSWSGAEHVNRIDIDHLLAKRAEKLEKEIKEGKKRETKGFRRYKQRRNKLNKSKKPKSNPYKARYAVYNLIRIAGVKEILEGFFERYPKALERIYHIPEDEAEKEREDEVFCIEKTRKEWKQLTKNPGDILYLDEVMHFIDYKLGRSKKMFVKLYGDRESALSLH